MINELIRLYSLLCCVIILILGVSRLRHWSADDPDIRQFRLAHIGLALALGIGAIEAINLHLPGGWRVPLVAIALTWLAGAYLYRPICDYKKRRSQRGSHDE